MHIATRRFPALVLVLCALVSLPGAQALEGAREWVKQYPQPDGSAARSCASCHGEDLTRPGRHATTGKVIEPLAPSVDPGRLSDPKKVEKWLLRNCRWTLGRECTATEKTAFIDYIRAQ